MAKRHSAVQPAHRRLQRSWSFRNAAPAFANSLVTSSARPPSLGRRVSAAFRKSRLPDVVLFPPNSLITEQAGAQTDALLACACRLRGLIPGR